VGVERWSSWASSRSDPASPGYRARYRDPLGDQKSRIFPRKADAQRFLIEMESDKARGRWIDPRAAEMPLATWSEEFPRLCRTESQMTRPTGRCDRDLGSGLSSAGPSRGTRE
jgi:hypothetical protein